mgnify:CR=1 FL=1
MNFAVNYLNATANETAVNGTNTTRFPSTFGNRIVSLSEKQIVALVFFILLGVFIVFGNTLVLAAFKINPRLRTIPNYFIFSLGKFAGMLSKGLAVLCDVKYAK